MCVGFGDVSGAIVGGVRVGVAAGDDDEKSIRSIRSILEGQIDGQPLLTELPLAFAISTIFSFQSCAEDVQNFFLDMPLLKAQLDPPRTRRLCSRLRFSITSMIFTITYTRSRSFRDHRFKFCNKIPTRPIEGYRLHHRIGLSLLVVRPVHSLRSMSSFFVHHQLIISRETILCW